MGGISPAVRSIAALFQREAVFVLSAVPQIMAGVTQTAHYGGKRTSGKFPTNTPKKTATLAHHFSGGAPGRETRASQGDFVAILLCVWQSCMMKRVTGAQFYKRELSLIVSMIVFFRFVFGVLGEGQGVYVSSK